jgi:hypothetical protein
MAIGFLLWCGRANAGSFGRLILCEGEEGVFEGRAGNLKIGEGFVAEEHLADYVFGVGGRDLDRVAVELNAGDGWESSEEVGGEARSAADGADSADALDLGWGAFADDATFVDDNDAVGEGVGLFEIVSGEENGLALSREGAYLMPESAAGFDVQANGGFVEKDEIGVATEGEGEEDALLLAAAELAEWTIFDALKLSDTEDFGDGQRGGVVAAEEIEMFPDAEGFKNAGDLKHCANSGASGGFARVAVEDLADAGGRSDEAEEDFDGRGFARAVGTEEGYDFAGSERQAETVEGTNGAVVLSNVG